MNVATGTLSKTALALVLALSVVAGTAAAASDASIDAGSAEPGVTTTHAVTVTVGADSAGSWNSLAVNYSGTGADLGNVGQGDVAKIGIDRGDDATGTTVDVNVSDDLSSVSAANNGETLRVGLGGSYELNEGDEVVVVYEDAVNPAESGEFDVGMDVNYQSSGGEAATTLPVGSTDDDASTTEMDDSTEMDDGDAEDGESTTDASGGSPGFGVAAVAAAVAGLALVARTRN
ncbi:hypothetical protein [Halorubellus salinus]|uniref:hypothetical protein n=1 Tax=Halorubellus salinus TaxID=755309 RepID=UPI001D092EA1|nr:hypothetical protein [Halorubellus salinus]